MSNVIGNFWGCSDLQGQSKDEAFEGHCVPEVIDLHTVTPVGGILVV